MPVLRTLLLALIGAALAAALSAATAPPESPPAGPSAPPGDRLAEGLAEFVAWAQAGQGGCAPASGIRAIERWDGGVRARYEIVCGGRTRALEAILKTREGQGVWQVAAGVEAEAPLLDAALADREAAGRAPRPGGAGGLEPPPENEGIESDASPLGVAVPAQVLKAGRPEYPEEAGRARLIGEARVELLVDVSPEGAPQRARPLRGPDPDLGMRRAAIEAVLRWSFRPATLEGRPVRYFAPVEVSFEGLPPESRHWAHRALFHVEALVAAEAAPLEEARRRLERGETLAAVAAGLAGDPRGGDWGFVSAAALPAPLRQALHEASVGGLAGPVAADGLHYLMLKRGEIYYAIRGGDLPYEILHQRNAPEGEALRRAVESDIADFMAERKRLAYVNEAARLMGIQQRRAEVGRLRIRTDALDENEIQVLGKVVEATVRVHEDFWSPIVPLRPFKEEVLVYAFARRQDHERLHRLWLADRPAATSGGPAGEYFPASRILAIPCEAMEGHLPVPILIHEALHMLDYERVYPAGIRPSQWFEEGLATYFGFSHVDGQLRIDPGEIRRSGTLVVGEVRLQFDPRTQLRDHLRRLRDEGPFPLASLLSAAPGDPVWGGGRTAPAYGAAWTLVHFLLHGERGRLRPAFLEYARLEVRGEGGPQAFARLFGPDLGPLEAAWHGYEEGL
jgi:TonB family protein